jgi:nucleotide-binding universal stress UspA family protein
MIKSILVGTDGSEGADIAVSRATELAALAGARLHVVSAYQPAPARVGGRDPVAEASEWSLGSDFKVEAVLDRAAASARAQGVDVEPHGRTGDPAGAIIEVAEQENVDLIVLGNKGMKGARRVLGSVPNKVSHQAPCDLLIVRTS